MSQTRLIIERLKQRHPAPEWAAFPELRAGTGASSAAQQAVDFYALNMYPSKRYASVAYEIKVSRSDFLRELAQPAKRVAAEKIANETWFVGPANVFKEEELPQGWGLLALQADNSFRRVRAAPWREVAPFSMTFIASLARRATLEDKPVLPAGVWKYGGREVDDARLVEIVKEAYGSVLTQELEAHARREVDAWLGGSDYQSDLVLLKHVKETCGIWKSGEGSVERFEEWAKAKELGIEPYEKARLRDALGQLVCGLKQVGVELHTDDMPDARRKRRVRAARLPTTPKE